MIAGIYLWISKTTVDGICCYDHCDVSWNPWSKDGMYRTEKMFPNTIPLEIKQTCPAEVAIRHHLTSQGNSNIHCVGAFLPQEFISLIHALGYEVRCVLKSHSVLGDHQGVHFILLRHASEEDSSDTKFCDLLAREAADIRFFDGSCLWNLGAIGSAASARQRSF